ncbi:unnamed protein product, partial [marine sediment metagenome]
QKLSLILTFTNEIGLSLLKGRLFVLKVILKECFF